jgi:hypothetical protein
MQTKLARILLLPYMLFGLCIAAGLTSRTGLRPMLPLLGVMFGVCLLALLLAVWRTAGGRRFLGMDRGLWVIGSTLSSVAGCVIGYFAMRGA